MNARPGTPDCVQFLQWALPRIGLRWSGFRKVRGTVCKRLRRRMRALGLADFNAYRAHFEAHSDERQILDVACRIPISRFWRGKRTFERLETQVLPDLARRARAAGRSDIRCWSIGCASGEEPYSLAILWRYRLSAAFQDIILTIEANDAESVMIHRAHAGLYQAGSLRDLPEDLRAAAFEEVDGQFAVWPEIKAMVTLRTEDIRTTLPDGPYDLILCRNLVFTYFDDVTQRSVLAALDARLRPGGYLVVGSHEHPPVSGSRIAAVEGAPSVFCKGADQPAGPGAQNGEMSRSSLERTKL